MSRPRKSRRLDLTLLLAVAPLLAACDEAEERHCVGPDGTWVDDRACEAPAGAAPHGGGHWAYVPRRHYGGAGAHAGSWSSHTSPNRGSAHVSRGGFGGTGHGAAHGGG